MSLLTTTQLPYAPRLDALGLEGKLRSFSELRGQRVDLLHVNSPFEQPSIGVLAAPVIAERTVVTCYDLIPYRFSDIYLPDAGAKAWYQSRLGMLVSSDAIVTDSQSAADDVVRMLNVDRTNRHVNRCRNGRAVRAADRHARRADGRTQQGRCLRCSPGSSWCRPARSGARTSMVPSTRTADSTRSFGSVTNC